jgi:multiple sugar transport system permease protein
MSAETVITPPSQVAAPPEPRRMAHGTRHRVQSRVFRIGRWVVIIGFLIATLVPFYYMLLLSVKPIGSLLQNPASLWVKPSEFTLQTYVDVLSSTASGGQGFGRFLVNSGVVALASVALALLIGIPGAYAIARLPFFGRRYVSGIFLAAYLFPAILMAIPLFVGFTRLGLRGNLVGLIIVYTAQTVPVAIYMLRNYFETVPEAIEEAGLVDG